VGACLVLDFMDQEKNLQNKPKTKEEITLTGLLGFSPVKSEEN